MYKWISFFATIAIVCATGPPYLPRPGLVRQQQSKIPVTVHKEFYVYSAPEETRPRKQQSSATGNTINGQWVAYTKSPENQRQMQIAMASIPAQSHTVKYHTADEVTQAIMQKYGSKQEDVQHLSAKTIVVPASLSLASLTSSLSSSMYPAPALPSKSPLLLPSHIAASRSYLAPSASENLEMPVVSAVASNAIPLVLPPTLPNTPVHKNYAQNFLPEGEDVVPGSSYIPLILKH